MSKDVYLIERTKNLQYWTAKVADMKNFPLNAEYTYAKPNNKYARFIDHFKGWVEELFGEKFTTEEYAGMNTTQANWKEAVHRTSQLPENWWSVAMDVANGKQVANTLPKLDDSYKGENASAVYEQFLPAYRALKESFDRRSFLQFIFNHRQYTAERDALKVVKTVLMTMTGCNQEELDAKYADYKRELPTDKVQDNLAEDKRLEEQERARQEELRLQEEMRLAREQEERVREMERMQEENKRREVEDLMTKKKEDLSAEQQGKLLITNETFKANTVKALVGAVQNSKMTAQLLNTLIGSQGYKILTDAATLMNTNFDEEKAIENVDGQEAAMEGGARTMFKKAFEYTKFLQCASLKDRIVTAQKMADIMLNGATPIGFESATYGKYGKGYAVLNDEEYVRSVLNENKIPEGEIDGALKDAKVEIGNLYPTKERIEIPELQEQVGEIQGKIDDKEIVINNPVIDK